MSFESEIVRKLFLRPETITLTLADFQSVGLAEALSQMRKLESFINVAFESKELIEVQRNEEAYAIVWRLKWRPR